MDHEQLQSRRQQLLRIDDHLPWQRQGTSVRQEPQEGLGHRTVRGRSQ